MALIAELGTDDEQLQQLGAELEDLDRKLPADLSGEDDKLKLRGLDELRQALDEVKSLLLERLEPQETRV